ncbi:uncharacterized protein [Temnothorax longispinosus]|uniref:uncharacterized protein n=1 Tax=Temnothorax longispinosus TaxID=300112 RepID=UPI003A9A06B1
MNGVIWSKTQKTFVPISSVPIYARMQQERLRQNRALEIHNFQLQNLTLTSFQEPHFLQFYDNNTKVTGLCGEIWNLLSESLNFTLQPVKVNIDGMGMPEEDLTYKHGLLGIIFRNETVAIPKIETFRPRLAAVDFSIPLWINRNQLYIHREMIYDNIWMVKIFSWEIWCIILIMYILLSLCTFLTQNIRRNILWSKDKCKNVSFNEHLFYNFGNLCNQGYTPKHLKKSRILEVSLGFFCSIIYMSFSALLFIYVTKSIFVPPFDSFESLVANTKYSVISLKGSTGDIGFKILNLEPIVQARTAKRLIIIPTIEDMHKMACSSKKKKYAIFQGEDMHKVNGAIICHLTNTGKPLSKIWVASGIVKNFKYKRTIDLG